MPLYPSGGIQRQDFWKPSFMPKNAFAPIWPSRLDHICIESAKPDEMIEFYRAAVGYEAEKVGDELWLLTGRQRRLLLAKGEARRPAFTGFWLDDAARLARLRDGMAAKGAEIMPSPSPLFDDNAFAAADPDGNCLTFGVLPYKSVEPAEEGSDLGGELQHYAVATTQLPKMVDFYENVLGCRVSDKMLDDEGNLTAIFFRSDSLHHTVAMFGAGYAELDHHSYEVQSWNDIRDWADHMGDLRIPMWWGPGRHGPGDNLFFMVEDPDGNKLEFSTELEVFSYEQDYREWPHEEHTLNLWGGAWMRD